MTSAVAHEIKRNKLLYVENRNNKKWSSLRLTDNVDSVEKQQLFTDCPPACSLHI